MKYLIYLTFLVVFDAVTKFWAANYLEGNITLIPHLLSLEYYENTGIAFSLPLTGILLKVITLLLIFCIFWYYWTYERSKQEWWLDMSYTLIFAGALGNGWERIFQNYVIDFISVSTLFICNFADIYITLGAI